MTSSGLDPQLTWNLVQDVRQVLEFPFMVNAFRAGTIVAVLSGLVGWFMVLRKQTFAGHTLAVVGFPGAAGAVLVGISATYGLFAFAVTAALLIKISETLDVDLEATDSAHMKASGVLGQDAAEEDRPVAQPDHRQRVLRHGVALTDTRRVLRLRCEWEDGQQGGNEVHERAAI